MRSSTFGIPWAFVFSLVALFVAVTPRAGGATVLTFDQIRIGGLVVPTISGNDIEQDYGDRVNGSPMAVPGGFFTYGEDGEGFTPNILLDYSTLANSLSLWEDGYGDLSNVLFGDQNSQTLRVQLTADPGFNVELYGFDLGGWSNADFVIDAVRVLSAGSTLFVETDVLVQGNFDGPRHTSFDFTGPLTAMQLLIEIDYSNLLGGQQDNIGIDNIRFGQDRQPDSSETVPEPATGLLLLAGVSLLAARARRRRVGDTPSVGA